MASERTSDPLVEGGSLPLDIDNVHILLQVEQEQIQKRTFTNWVNAQLSKRRPPVTVLDLFNDFRDGTRLLDLLEVMCGQRMSREKGKGMFQHRAHIEKGLAFLKRKSIKLVNINVSDIMDGKPSIILGLIWTIIMHFHIEELASTLSFSSRQSSLESLASLDTRSTSSSARSSPVPPRGSPLHTRFRISAKKALLLWVREQCHKAGCTLNVKDFKASWRSGVVFLAILYALRPDLVDLSKARSRTNRQNLEEAFRIAERELHIPRLLDPADVDVRDPDERSIMTYVAQFLQYSKDAPADEEMQTSTNQKAQEVTCWLEQAYQELLEGWDSTEGESYSERYHVFHTFIVSFNEQRRPVMPLLTAMKRTPRLSEEQRALRHAWDSLAEKLREYKTELDLSMPAPLDTVGRWLLRVEEALADGEADPQDHSRAAQEAREKQELLKVCLEEMPHHIKMFQNFQNMDEYGEMLVPADKLEEMKRRFTSVRVSSKYHGIKLEYQEHRHTVLDLLARLKIKLCAWKRAYISQEAVRVLVQDWNETVNKQTLPSMLEGSLYKLKHIASKYTSKSALAGDSSHVSKEVKTLEMETAATLQDVKMVKGIMGRVLAAWDSYCDSYSSLHAWLEQGTQSNRHGQRAEVTAEMMAEWSSRQAHLNDVGNYLIESTDPQTSRSLSDELCRINLLWADFVRRTQFDLVEESSVRPASPQTLQCLVREANQLLKEPVEVLSGSLRTYRKRLQFMMKKIKDVDLDSLTPSPECLAETLSKLKQAIPEVLQTLCEAMQVCEELQQSVCGLDGRLAELLHWEAEAREFYQLLKERAHKHQRGEDARTRLLISRGLQLEGQVVMEEQDLQVMVMSGQKNSPLQYLISSAMQDRVRATVAQSQEAVGLLSSLGARRDRSPTGRQPPQKIFVQERECETESNKRQTSSTTESMSASEDREQTDFQPPVKHRPLQPSRYSAQVAVPKTQPEVQPVPMIVVQEYHEEKKSPPLQTYQEAQAVAKTQLWKEPREDPQHILTSKGHEQAQTFAKVKPQAVTKEQAKAETKEEPMQQELGDTNETVKTHKLHLNSKQSTLQAQISSQQQMPACQQIPTQPEVNTQQQNQQSTTALKQLDIHQQTQAQQQQIQVEQHDTQKPIKVRKSQARSEHRPWLQQKGQAEVLTTARPKDKSKVSSEVHLKTTVAVTVAPTPDPIEGQAEWVTQTQTKLSKPPETQPKLSKIDQPAVKQAKVSQVKQQQSVTQAKVSEVQQQQPGTQARVSQAQQQQSVTQAKADEVQQQQPLAQMLSKAQPPAMISTEPLRQPQTLISGPAEMITTPHPPPQATAVMNQRRSEIQTMKHVQPQAMPPVCPQVMPQRQPPTMIQAHPQLMSQTQQHLMEMGEAQQTERLPPVLNQPQVMSQSQPHPALHYAQTQTAQPRSIAPIQPRIITMPPSQPQIHVPPQSQIMGMDQTQAKLQVKPQSIVQPQVQPQVQHPEWRPMAIEGYYEVQGQGLMQAQIYPQSHPQTQGVRQMQAHSQQWTSLGRGLATQTYTSVQGSGQVQVQPHPQSHIYPVQTQQWGIMRSEPMAPTFTQMRPQSQVQPIAPPQHWRPIRPEVISHSFQSVQTQDPRSISPYSHAQPQACTRPQTPPQHWRPIQSEPQSQIHSQKMVPKVSQPAAHKPSVQPPFQAPVRSQGPPPQQPQAQQQQLAQNRVEAPSGVQVQIQVESQTPQALPQVQVSQKLQSLVQEQAQQQSAPRVKPPALAQAPPQAYTEAYSKAQALARNRFEEAKHCLQEHILEAINIFKEKRMTEEQKLVKEETLKVLDSELLEEFLRAAEGMEAFCTPSQFRDMEFFAQSVRTQWEACFSADGSLVQAGQQLEALKELCDTLSPEDAHRLAQAQLRECEKRLAAIQRQFSGDRDTPPPDAGVPVEQTKESSPQKIFTASVEKATEVTTPEVTPVTAQRPKTVDKKEIIKQMSTEDDRYRSSRFALQAQLNRNEQSMLGGRPSESTTDLRKRLRELKALRDETESLWAEYEVQCSQCVQMNERAVEQDRAELTVKWREQRAHLQSRVDSLGSALELMDSIEHHIAEISERLDKFIKEPKDIKGYTLVNTNVLKDIKDLDESIQAQMDRLSRFDSEPSNLDLRDRSPLTQVVLTHRSSLDRLRQQVRKSDAAARALDRFLMSLRTVDQDVSAVQSVPCSGAAELQDSRAKLALIRKGVGSLKDKAPQLDQLLGGARLEVTREGRPVSCLDMVGALVRQAEDADDRLMIHQEGLRKEQQSQGVRLRRKTLLSELRKVRGAAEKQGLKEPTMPAVQHRIRALSDLDAQINSLRSEYQSIRGTASKPSPDSQQPGQSADELDSLWEETERAVAERQEQCRMLMELLKKFQTCRSYLGSTLQRAEQTVSEQSSYMSKDSLQRLLAKVSGIKDDLSGLGPKMEEFRTVCRQLQSQLKKIPDCSETPFESEADVLVDSWLDVSEKTDTYMDNLRVGLELWEKQLMLGGELEGWAAAKLNLFAESHPLSTEREVLLMKDDIQTQEENIERFHRKSLEIQSLLQSKEAPLELQVMETGLRKKMEEVKEVFSGCTEVFQELLTVRDHLVQRIDACRSAIQRIQSSVSMLSTDDGAQLQQHLQDLSEQLLDQEDQADSLMKEITLMSSVTGPQAIEELTSDCKRLKDSITTSQELIGQKKEQGEKSLLVQSIKDECQLFEDWLQDVQLSVNECFENPERRQDVEASMQRLQGFLASKEGEQRLLQVKESVESKGQIPAETQAQLCVWQQEQEGEMATLRAHCQGRHKQLHDILRKLNSLQEEHDHLREWLEQNQQIPEQREKLRQAHEDFLKESGRVEAFSDLLASVRLRGLRADPLLKDSESLVDQYHSLGIRLENQAQVHEALEKEVESFHAQEDDTRSWIRELKQGLDSLDKDASVEEKLYKAQAVLNLYAEGNSKLAALNKARENLCAHDELEDIKQQELLQNLRNIEDEWRRLVDSTQQLKSQAELQNSLLRELEALQAQERSVRFWVEEQRQKLDHLDKDVPHQDVHSKVQDVLNQQHEGNSKLMALRNRGASICAHKELGSEKRYSIEQNHRHLEEEWEKVLQAAQELKNQIEHKDLLFKELQTFQDQRKDTQAWIRQLKENLESLDNACSFQERFSRAQAILNQGPEGDSKLAALRDRGESVCACDGLEEDMRQSVQQTLRGIQEEWTGVQESAQKLKSQADLQEALSKELQDFNSQAESVQTWVMEKQQRFESLDKGTPVEDRLNISQAILDLQPEGDSKLSALKMKGESVGVHRELEESEKHSIQRTLRDLQEKWRMVLEIAEELRKQAELQDSLSREFQAFESQEENMQSWVGKLNQDLDSLGKSTHGTQEQIEERLNKAQAVLSLRPEGNCKMASLKRRAESLCTRKDLDEDVRRAVLRKLRSLEEEWKGVLQHGQELHSLLRSVVERLVSCQCQRQQTQSRLEQLKKQTEALPRCFSWPGLGDRRHTVEQARALLDKTRSLTPTLSALRAVGWEMSQLTRDPSWSDPSWVAMEEHIPELIKELTELCESLDEGIHTERICAQLVEQHSAAQDWLREQVKGFGALPTDRHGLQGSITTLKALLQTADREEREMKELDVVKDSLINLCTPGGRDALTLEVSQLHDLCASSEREMRERLAMCESRLADIDLNLAGRAQDLRAQAEGLLEELRAQDHCLKFGEGNRTVSQLQENWHNCKTSEKELEELEGKVRDLGQVLRMVPSDEDLPSDVIVLIDTVTQKYCSLRSKLLERQNDCADSVVRCMREALHALHTWNQSTQSPSDSASSMQAMIEEGAGLHKSLQVAVSHKQLLRDCLGPELAGKLERDSAAALKDADTLINTFKQELQDLEEKVKQEALRLSLETQKLQLDSQVSTERYSPTDTATKAELDWSKQQDITPALTTMDSQDSKETDKRSVQSSELLHQEVPSVIDETLGKTASSPAEQEEIVAMHVYQVELLNDDLSSVPLSTTPKQECTTEPDVPLSTPATGEEDHKWSNLEMEKKQDEGEFDLSEELHDFEIPEGEGHKEFPGPECTEESMVCDAPGLDETSEELMQTAIAETLHKEVPISVTEEVLESPMSVTEDVLESPMSVIEEVLESPMSVIEEILESPTSGEPLATGIDSYQGERKIAGLLTSTSSVASSLETKVRESVISVTESTIDERTNERIEREQKGIDKIQPPQSEEIPGYETLEEKSMELLESERTKTEVDEEKVAKERVVSEWTAVEKTSEDYPHLLTTPTSTTMGHQDQENTEIQSIEILRREIGLTEETSEKVNSPIAEQVLAALEMDTHQSKSKTLLSTTALTVPSELLTELNESTITTTTIVSDTETSEEKKNNQVLESEGPKTESEDSFFGLRSAMEVTVSKRTEMECTAEDGLGKYSCILDAKEHVEKTPVKKVATLVLDTDAVHIHTTESLRESDPSTATVVSGETTGYDITLSDPVESLDTGIQEGEESQVAQEEVSKGSSIFLGEQEKVSALNAVASTEEISDETSIPLTEITETQETRPPPRVVGTLTSDIGQNAAHHEREGSWTTDNGPQQARRVMEPLGLEDWTDNGPREIQRRYIILDQQEDLQIHQAPAAEATMPALDVTPQEPGEVHKEASELTVPGKLERASGEESVETEVSEMMPLKAKDQTEELEATPTPPARRKLDSVTSEKLSFSTEDRPVESLHSTCVEVDKTPGDKPTAVKAEPKPTPPTRRWKESDRLSLSLEDQSEFSNVLPIQVPHPEVLPTPPNRRRKDKLGGERLSLDLDSQPTPPERRQKEKGEDKLLSFDLELHPKPPSRRQKDKAEDKICPSTELEKISQEAFEEPLVKPTPPVRRKASRVDIDTISMDSKTEEMEALVKPTPPARRRHSRNLSDTISKESASSTDLEKIISPQRAMEESLVKPTPPVRRKVSRAESEISISKLEEMEMALVKPTPPTRRRDSKIESDKYQLQESFIKPTPPLRRKDSRAESEKTSAELEETLPKPVPTPPIRQKKDKADVEMNPMLEEPLIKLSPPTRCKGKTERVEVQPTSKQDDEEKTEEKSFSSQEHSEKGLVPADVESTETLTQTESKSFIQTLVQDVQQPDTLAQDTPIARNDEFQAEMSEEEEPVGPTMKDIFTEIKKMFKTGPNSLLIESMPHEDNLDILDTSVADLEAQLDRLVIRTLSCRNLPAVINPTDMAKQVEDAEHCRQSAQKQVSSISKQDQANGDVSIVANGSAYDPEAMQRLSCQWTAALWDAIGTVHTKETQLQLVIDYDRQTQKVKAAFEKLSAELEALKICPVESSFVEEQRLRSFLRTMDQERTVLGELIQTHSQLSPHLSLPERAAAQAQVNITQCEWRVLERSVEKTLHNVSAYTKESFGLLQEIKTLMDHLENLRKILASPRMSSVLWDNKRAQDMIEISADLTAAQQSYLHLQKRSDALSQGFSFKTETCSIEQGLQGIKDKLDLLGERLLSSTPKSSNPTMVKIVKVITDALAWAKQTQRDIEGRKRKVSLLPEEVHQQIKDLKKLQSEMSLKQTQLEALTEEVTELSPELDEADVPMVTSFLEELKGLSKSTAKKLDSAIEEVESSLQTREKISEHIADVATWILRHLQREALKREDYQSLSAADLDRRLRQSQDTLGEVEKQSAVTEALLMKSKDIASELSISENAWLNEKLFKLQEDIKGVICYEKACSQEITDLLQNQDTSQKKVSSLEKSLREIMVHVKECRFPITKDSLSALEPFKHTIVEHKCQVEQVSPCAEDKRRELLCMISELHHKMKALNVKAQSHERFLSLRQRLEDHKENIEVQVPKTKDESIDKEERYITCQALLTQILFIKPLCKEASDELENISGDLYPSQLTAEQKRLKQNINSLNTWEMAVQNNLQIVEWEILKDIHYPSEQRAVQDFLKETNRVQGKPCKVEPKQSAIDQEFRKCLNLRKSIEARMQVLEVLENKKGVGHKRKSQKSKHLADLAKMALDNCDQRMNNLSEAKELLKNYSMEVTSTIRFLQESESLLLPSLCSARSCSERLKDIQQALSTLDTDFQSHVTQLQTLAPFHPVLSKHKTEHLHVEILSHLLVRESTLKAQAQLWLEAIQRCVNCQKTVRMCYEELCQKVRDLETILAEVVCKKMTSQKDCTDQQEKLKILVEEVNTLPGRLEELKEWCPVQGCYANREDAVSALWGQVAKLQRCARELQAHSEQRGEEWIGITKSMEQASVTLDQTEAELPELNRGKATGDELQELLQFCSQYQDRLDCQHRALSALELRAARLLGVPSHLEQAPLIPLCQQLQTMQEQYHSLKERSARGRKTAQAEMEQREKVREELQGVREWLVAAATLLSGPEHVPQTKQLQEVHSELCTQKAVLHRIMEGLRMKYSDMYTLVPVEIEGLLQEVSLSLQEVEEQVDEAVEKSGPLHRLDARLSEIKAGLESVQIRLEQKSPNVLEAENTQKRVWDELDGLHSRLAGVEVELQDVSEEKPEETQVLTERLAQTQQLHTRLTKQAEERTAFLSKMRGWLQEHEEMVKGSQSWITEAQSWLTAPCTYTTAKCLDGHVNALQMVLDDSEQIRRTLQGFEGVLKEMQDVCDVSGLRQELCEAEQRVANMQQSLLGPLSQLEHAAAEVDAMESELKIMEKDVTDLRSALTSKEGISQDKLKAAEGRIELMKRTVAELQSCKAGLCLPEGAESALTVFKSAEILLNQLLELEQLVLEHTVVVVECPAAVCEKPTLSVPPTIAEEEVQDGGPDQGLIKIVHLKDNVLSGSGAVLMTVEESSPEQRLSWVTEKSDQTATHSQQPRPEEEEEEEEEEEADVFVDVREEEEAEDDDDEYVDARTDEDEEYGISSYAPGCETCTVEDADSGGPTESTEQDRMVTDAKDVEPAPDASAQEAGPEPTATVRTQSPPKELASAEAGVLRVCVEKAAVLEVCLEQARVSLGQSGQSGLDSSMQHSIERQLQNCQEMFVEIEQKVSSVSALGNNEEEQRALSAKLQRLKKNLLTFQLLLQERHTEEQACVERERPLQVRLQRSCSVQEILTSNKGKLFRQSSLQQQRELEQRLSEQRELTKVIAARGRLHSQTTEEHTGLFAPAAVEQDELRLDEEQSVQRKWTHLHQRLTQRLTQRAEQEQEDENSETGESVQISIPSLCVWSSADGTVCLQELQSHITHLRQLGHRASTEPVSNPYIPINVYII
uniref:Calponin-homology (CH) domain-containing protein n=1 Tax=Pygocentrus nattereri TaxID=42514 RepID=A0AAR2KFY0_PYGNA